ncbi:hypothetical protein [Ureibacillus sp. FSL E2-3493]|uniref:hypothetical protein n=1 Tax=Ureibacillus sp. FSL E2-3493 TaxID=2921367 RepID=UPI0031195553
MDIIIKKYEAKEEKQLKSLVQVCFEDEVLLEIIKSTQLISAYSAIFEDKLVGIICAWKSKFHPFCTYFRILINPIYNSLNIEKHLLSKLENLKIKNLPLQTSVWETSNKLVKFYINNGFRQIRRTYSPILKVSDVADYLPNIQGNYQILTLTEVLPNIILTNQLIQLVRRIYIKTHVANPVANFDEEKWRKMIFADDTVYNGSYIYLDTNENSIVAYAFLHESDKIDSLELGWCGAIDTKYIQLISDLIHNQVNYALNHNIQFIIGEFDTTDDYAMEVLTNFPFAPSPTWITLQKDVT